MKFVQLAGSLKEEISPFYLIEGEEAYFRDHAVRQIQSACALAAPELNDVRYEGDALKGERLYSFRDELYSAPFFDERRIARVYEFYPTERDWEQALCKYAQSPCPSTVLIVVNTGKSGKKGGFDLKRHKGVAFVDCARADEETLSKWLFGVMRKSGLSVDADAAQMMVRYCAQDAARLRQETEKLRLLLGAGGRVTRATVEEYVAKDVEYRVYELTQAASRKAGNAFWEIFFDLTRKGYDENAALAALTAHYRTLYDALRIKGSDAEAAQVLGIKPYAVQKNREQARRLGEETVRRQYLGLYRLSCGVRCGDFSKTDAFYAAVAKIFFD